MEHLFPYPKTGSSFLEVLHHSTTRKLLGFDAVHAERTPFIYGITSRLKFLLNDASQQLTLLKIGYTALEAFLQANCTGPPLDFSPDESIFPEEYRDEGFPSLKEEIFQYLSVDGSRPYPLTPHIGLFWLAKVLMANPTLAEAGFNGRRGRVRVNFWHQKLLSEESPTLRETIYADADILEQQLVSRHAFGGAAAEEHLVEFLIERAVVRTHYGDDVLARTDLARAATTRQFQFALTGVLGKRTKFQDRDISQLVVLAKSRDIEPEPYSSRKGSRASIGSRKGSEDGENSKSKSPNRKPLPGMSMTPLNQSSAATPIRPSTPSGAVGQEEVANLDGNTPTRPENVPLNDDTLLERIRFKSTLAPISEETMTHVVTQESSLPPQLAVLDPSDQPLLFPVDSIILLATASSISNTSPDDGLVREETLPYAARVLEGGSSNWQVYTQALLVRSRIEGFRARTAERGLLQLQALVDQVIAETSETAPPTTSKDAPTSEPSPSESAPSTFFPKPKASESASVSERLKYVHQLSPPLKWELEAELAARWTHMGGLKTALEIYERLQMHAEVALCLAATDREAEAVKLLKELLFEDSAGKPEEDGQSSTATLTLRSPPHSDSPRLLCILGDITGHPAYYTLAWTVSSNRYARAQRSLGRYYTKQRDFRAASEAYTQALSISRLDRGSWFAFGCVQLELEEWNGATESFTRCVQLDDHDAEAWSNLAIALLKLPIPQAEAVAANLPPMADPAPPAAEDEEPIDPVKQQLSSSSVDHYQHTREALRALRRAATLKRDDARIWDNYLTVAASIPPSAGTPWGEVIQAMGRVVELRSKKEGERSVDLAILKVLTDYVLSEWVYPAPAAEEEEEAVKGLDDNAADEGGESGQVEKDPTIESDPTTASTTTTTTNAPKKLPYLPRSFLSLIDTSIAPVATSSPQLYALLSQISLWRHRPAQSLQYAEKSWLAQLNALTTTASAGASAVTETTFDDLTDDKWASVVEKTLWIMRRYAELGPMQRERTGGEVEAKWAFKARSAGRRVLGRAKTWAERGDENWAALKAEIDRL